jgi:hypothetical protein
MTFDPGRCPELTPFFPFATLSHELRRSRSRILFGCFELMHCIRKEPVVRCVKRISDCQAFKKQNSRPADF